MRAATLLGLPVGLALVSSFKPRYLGFRYLEGQVDFIRSLITGITGDITWFLKGCQYASQAFLTLRAGFWVLGYISTMKENQMEKNMYNEMNTGIYIYALASC